MGNHQKELLDTIQSLQLEHTKAWLHYWLTYSSFHTWQFWLNIGFLILPLILLYFAINRKKAFFLGFYGYSTHVWYVYIDAFGASQGYWLFPYKLIPFLPVSFALDVSLAPVSYMLIYQWVLKHNKNYYLYMALYSAFMSFIFKPIMVAAELFQLNRGASYLTLFIGYFSVAVIAKWITNVFIHLKKTTENI
ncbi:CBO0543 family protein [Bacillus sp. SJS]|uniref:CBO0543 family protein n=1 Tax=Bacillus sp. SJS TaxID=1423321 RepID=UPI0004DCF9A1|nr:CBO0543 family protein [Bacillus sp. SJS]KZZ83288.1 hypothetical protein AS29_016160 [Bacillus sp. SJS]